MKISELKEFLENILLNNGDMEVLIPTSHSTLVRASRIGTITTIPTDENKNLLPGNEWRVPTSSKDKPEATREHHFIVY